MPHVTSPLSKEHLSSEVLELTLRFRARLCQDTIFVTSIWARLLQVLHRLRSEASLIFTRDDERLDHFGVNKVAVELIELAQPEVITGVI